MISTKEFIREYAKAIIEGYAAVFAGAGLSRESGYINWKELVRPLAEDIGLDVDKEHDLIAVAQYFRNERCTRAAINQIILNEFTQDVKPNQNVEILTRLPISTYWTTNYDELLELSLKGNNRKADVKTNQEDLANNIYDRDAVVYKMHGDARRPDKAVLTKDDYEIYGRDRSLFRTVLQGDLISKTFLFIGFSFEDPNLEYVLSQIRILLGESTRDHYCFLEKISKKSNEAEKDYLYNVAKQELRVRDLQRYGIHAIILDNYGEITDILNKIERATLMKNIFIAGSLEKCEGAWNIEDAHTFTQNLSKKLVHHGCKIVSGYGVGIGSSIITGALEEIMQSKYKHTDEHLCLRPFPRDFSDPATRDKVWQTYREDMINQAGIAIFIFGNKKIGNEIVISDGMKKEFEIAKTLGKLIIPVGSTGGAAMEILESAKNNIGEFPYLEDYLEILESETNYNELIDLVWLIIQKQQVI